MIVHTTRRRAARTLAPALLGFIIAASGLWVATDVHHVSAQAIPTCSPAPGRIQVVGLQLVLTARPGDANDLRIAFTGGAYTPPESGQPLTSSTYAVTDPGASSAYVPETVCATDEAATCLSDDAGGTTCTAIITEIVVDLGDGDDSASLAGVPAPTFIGAGAGNDTVAGGENRDVVRGGASGDFIAGGEGDDDIDGGPGWDTLDGGPGDDTISGGSTDPFATSGNDTVRGGPGHDTLDGGSGSLTDPDRDLLDYSDHVDPVYVALNAGAGTDSVTGFEDVLGGAGDDEVHGDDAANRIDGGAGADLLDGRGGANEVLGGEGDDVLRGGYGNEQLDGGPGDDRIYDTTEGDAGDSGSDDTLLGGDGADRIAAGTGANVVHGGTGDDWLIVGCRPADTVASAVEHSELYGEDDDDTITVPGDTGDYCGGGVAVLGISNGGDGVDVLDRCAEADPWSPAVPVGYRPLAAADWTACSQAAELLIRASGEWVGIEDVIGGQGDDIIIGFGGYVNGAPGGDNLTCGTVLNGGPGTVDDNGDWLRECTGASYRAIADYSSRTHDLSITLTFGVDDGRFDRDTNLSLELDRVEVSGGIRAGSGRDRLTGDLFANVITGADGDDQIDARAGADVISGGAGADSIDAGPGADVISGGDGDDSIQAGDGADDVDAGDGNDLVAGEDFFSGDGGVNEIAGGAGNDSVFAGSGGDRVDGGPGDDSLAGSIGADELRGGDGKDFIHGAGGPDLLDGGAGSDFIESLEFVTYLDVSRHAPDLVTCGPDGQTARVDRLDTVVDCPTVTVATNGALDPGESFTSDLEGDGATPAHPVELTVTLDAAAASSSLASMREGTPPGYAGYEALGTRYSVSLPPGTAEVPVVLTFRIDASVIPAGQDQSSITIFRNGVAVPECDASPPRVVSTAAPDPCVSARRVLADGDVEIVVLTSRASDWDAAIDVTAPAITIVSPSDGADLILGSVGVADFACLDKGSGVASCVGSVPDGSPLDTGTVGAKTLTVTAEDVAGNEATATAAYRVIYDFEGFFSPLENPGHVDGLLNVVKAGASVPVRFSLDGDQGLQVLAAGSPTSVRIACDTAVPTDVVEETAGAGSSGLTYDPANGTYRYVWKTDKTWAGTCRRLSLRLADGTEHVAAFRLTR